ncbi:MAG: (2Fe-2S)-binding protein [Desulfatibacillaceae bacterium]
MSDKCNGRDEKQRRGVTRRGFIQVVGAGAVGASVAGAAMAASGRGKEATRTVEASELARVRLVINGTEHSVLAEPRWTLLYVLREVIGYTATKEGCSRGECGACTVLIDNIPRYACMTLAVEAEGREITTLEGLLEGENIGAVQTAFLEEDAFQCGYCTPGQIMAVEGLLRRMPDPDMDAIRMGVSGNLCRCGAYTHIFKAAEKAAKRKRKG